MIKRIFHSVLAVSILAHDASACQSLPETSYDDFRTEGFSIATATVFSVETEHTATRTCWSVSYVDAAYLYGSGKDTFSVKTCSDEVFQIKALSDEVEGFDYLGFVPHADILVGLVYHREQISELRYALPSCWGPMHVNLGKMSDTERAKFLQDLTDQIKHAQ